MELPLLMSSYDLTEGEAAAAAAFLTELRGVHWVALGYSDGRAKEAAQRNLTAMAARFQDLGSDQRRCILAEYWPKLPLDVSLQIAVAFGLKAPAAS